MPVTPGGVRCVEPPSLPPRRLTELRTWRFCVEENARHDAVVVVPESWSRRDPLLADFHGPARYERRARVEGTHARLLFEQLDYVAEVYLDGELAALHEGGFTPVAVDLPAGRDVAVTVRLDDPEETSVDCADPLLEPKRKIKGVHDWHDSRPGGMAMGDQFDVAWTKRWGTGGITAPVWVHETGPVRLDAVFATARPGALRLSFVTTNLGAAPLAATLVAAFEDAAIEIDVVLPLGAGRTSVRLDVAGEQLWSPESPVVYSLRAGVVLGGDVSDTVDVPVGFRSLEMAVSGPRAYQMHVNDQRTYVRAANYIPGVWPAELPAATIARDVELATAAGLNSLGVHAGVCKALLPLADRAGLLVYQDFPLQWSYDPAGPPLREGLPGFADASTQLAAELVYDLYNHPCLVYWCGHNEPAYQLAEAFATAEMPELQSLMDKMAAYPDERELDERRGAVLAHVDPSRPSFSASGLGASRDEGDVHDYAGSLSGGHVTRGMAGKTAFVSEYGAWSANPSAVEAAVGARGDWPPGPESEPDWHGRTHLVATQSMFAGRPDRFADFPTWCFAGQLWAGWHAKVFTEAARLAKYAPSGGARYHFFVDHWGQGGAGVVDRHRTTGPAYRGLAAANRPVIALAPFPPDGVVRPGTAVRLPVFAVNDRHDATRRVPLHWRLAQLGPGDAFLVGRDVPHQLGALQSELAAEQHCAVLPRAGGRTLLSGEVDVELTPDSCQQVAEVSWTADVEGPVALFLELDGHVGWTSFVVADEHWRPVPGLAGPSRFSVVTELARPLRRRWTGDVVDPAAAPPDQYLLGDVAIDVWDDVTVDASGVVKSNPLPWPDPL